jgi:EmrB/QacA subfamily drug resistance transporter
MASSTEQASFLSTRRGRLTLALVCLAGFLDFIDTTIVNVALPSIRQHLGFSAASSQWVVSGYLLTYGGFLLLGGRAADLLGRRRLLVTGTTLFGLSSLIGGLAGTEGMLIASRLTQGLGAAMMTPAALSILTTSFTEGTDRVKALGVWSGTIPLASAVGVLAGGLLSQGPGWRWVFFVNLPVCAVVIASAKTMLGADRPEPVRDVDILGAILPTASALTFVYALVNASRTGWGSPRTVAELAGAALLIGAFVINELRRSNPLFPLSIFKVRGLAAADATQVIAQAGFLSLFFFITLYMQTVLHMSPIEAGAAYIPVTICVGISSGISTQLLPRIGSRPLIVAGTLIGAVGVFLLSRITADGSYVADVLPGLVVMALGLGAVFVGVQNAANAGVPAEQAGLAAALISASATLGGALGLAILSAISTSRTNHLLAAHASHPVALTSGFGHALLVCSLFLVAAAVIAARTASTRGWTKALLAFKIHFGDRLPD